MIIPLFCFLRPFKWIPWTPIPFLWFKLHWYFMCARWVGVITSICRKYSRSKNEWQKLSSLLFKCQNWSSNPDDLCALRSLFGLFFIKTTKFTTQCRPKSVIKKELIFEKKTSLKVSISHPKILKNLARALTARFSETGTTACPTNSRNPTILGSVDAATTL